jgi:hypothetical protein
MPCDSRLSGRCAWPCTPTAGHRAMSNVTHAPSIGRAATHATHPLRHCNGAPALHWIDDDRLGAMLDIALNHARLGRAVLPCHSVRAGRCTCGRPRCSSAGKHPRTSNGVHDATTNPAQIAVWFRCYPAANLAVATGAVSCVDVLDVDPKHDGPGTLARLRPARMAAATAGVATASTASHCEAPAPSTRPTRTCA